MLISGGGGSGAAPSGGPLLAAQAGGGGTTPGSGDSLADQWVRFLMSQQEQQQQQQQQGLASSSGRSPGPAIPPSVASHIQPSHIPSPSSTLMGDEGGQGGGSSRLYSSMAPSPGSHPPASPLSLSSSSAPHSAVSPSSMSSPSRQQHQRSQSQVPPGIYFPQQDQQATYLASRATEATNSPPSIHMPLPSAVPATGQVPTPWSTYSTIDSTGPSSAISVAPTAMGSAAPGGYYSSIPPAFAQQPLPDPPVNYSSFSTASPDTLTSTSLQPGQMPTQPASVSGFEFRSPSIAASSLAAANAGAPQWSSLPSAPVAAPSSWPIGPSEGVPVPYVPSAVPHQQ